MRPGGPHILPLAMFFGTFAWSFVYVSLIGASFVGPVIATTLLSWTSPPVLYLVLAAMGAACLPFAAMARSRARA